MIPCTTSSAFSSWGTWPHLGIISNVDPGMAAATRLAFHAGTIRSLSPVITRTARGKETGACRTIAKTKDHAQPHLPYTVLSHGVVIFIVLYSMHRTVPYPVTVTVLYSMHRTVQYLGTEGIAACLPVED